MASPRGALVAKNDVKVFSSIKDCLIFLNTIAPSNKTTLYRYVKSSKPYHGFICKFDSDETVSLSDKSIQIVILDTYTNISTVYSSIRKAALSFAPNIKTTGQTIKAYVDSGKLFKDPPRGEATRGSPKIFWCR